MTPTLDIFVKDVRLSLFRAVPLRLVRGFPTLLDGS